MGASIVALLLVSSLFSSSLEIGNFFSSVFSRLGKWFGGSPLDGLFSSPKNEPKNVSISISGYAIEIDPTTPISMESATANFTNFVGSLNISFSEGVVKLSEKSTGFVAVVPILEFTIYNLTMASVTFENVAVDITSYINTDNGTVIIKDFQGMGSIGESLRLEGNASSLNVKVDGLDWELK